MTMVQGVTIHDVAVAAAQHFGVDLSELMGPTRRKDVVRARHLAMYIGRDMLSLSVTEISEQFGRQHSAVTHAVIQMRKLVLSQATYHRFAADIAARLGLAGVPGVPVDVDIADAANAGLVALHSSLSTQQALFDRLSEATQLDMAFNTGRNVLRNFISRIRVAVVRNGCDVRIVLTDPAQATDDPALCPGKNTMVEGAEVIEWLRTFRDELASQPLTAGSFSVRIRARPPTCSLLIMDDQLVRVTPYLPHMDADEVPAFDFVRTSGGLFPRYRRAFDRLWSLDSAPALDSLTAD